MHWSHNFLLLSVFTVLFGSAFSCVPGQYECDSYQGRWSCLEKSQLCDGKPDCHWKEDEEKCDVIPEVRVSCDKTRKDGYYKGKKVTCSCKVRREDYDIHKGFAQWLKNGVSSDTPQKSIILMSNTSEANKGYRCSGQSALGQQDSGSALDPKFAYFDDVKVMLSPTLLTVCSSDSSSRQVVCKVPKESVNPAPYFNFYGDGKILTESVPAIETDTHYQQVLDVPGPSGGGVMEISCHVTNPVFNDLKQEVSKPITLRQPPPQPPVINVLGQTFQGVSSINIATLPQNFTGVLTCSVSGGFPEARIGSLACGDNIGFSKDLSGTVRFQNAEVTRSMHDVYCSCTADHDSGCFDNSETKVKVKVLFPKSQEQSGSEEVSTIVIPVILAIIIVLLIIVIAILVLRQRNQGGVEGTKSERVQLNEQKA